MTFTQRKLTNHPKPTHNPYARNPAAAPKTDTNQPKVNPTISSTAQIASSGGGRPSPSVSSPPTTQPPPSLTTRLANVKAGNAKNTKDQKKSHLSHYDKIQTCALDFTWKDMEVFSTTTISPPSTITPNWTPQEENVELVKCQMMQSLRDYVDRVTSHEYDHEVGAITLDTLRLYVGTIIEAFQQLLKKSHVPVCSRLFAEGTSLTQFKNWVTSNWNKSHRDGNNSLGKVDFKCLTLPRTSEGDDIIGFSKEGLHNISQLSKKISLLFINEKLFRKGKYTEGLSNSLNFICVGRACEPFMCSYDRMGWHPPLNSTLLGWYQSKTGISTPLTIIPDFTHFETCVFNGLGCLWMLEDGLFRDGGEDKSKVIEYRNAHMIFSTTMSSEKVNRAIKDTLPDGVAFSVTNKSIRRGAASHMANTPGISYFETLSRGGWSTGTNMDVYLEWSLASMQPSLLALAGYPDIRMKAVNPSTGCLPEDRRQQCTVYLEFLFPNKLPCFKQSGRLFSVRNIVLATMIMNFNEMVRKYGPRHPVPQCMMLKWDEAASCAGGDGQEVVQEDPRAVLRDMSSMLRRDFDKRVKESAISASVDPSLLRAFNAQKETMQQVLLGMQERERANEEKWDTVKERLSQLERDNEKLRNSIGQLLSHIMIQNPRSAVTAPQTPSSPSKCAKRAAEVSPPDQEQQQKKVKAVLDSLNGPVTVPPASVVETPAKMIHPYFGGVKKSKSKVMSQKVASVPPKVQQSDPKAAAIIAQVRFPSHLNPNMPPLRMDSKLSSLLEWEYGAQTFAQLFPFSRIVHNTYFTGGFVSGEANKYRTALNVAFQLLTPEQQQWMCKGGWPKDPIIRKEAFKDVDILYYWLDAMFLTSRIVRQNMRPTVSSVCNRFRDKRWKEKFPSYNKFQKWEADGPSLRASDFPFQHTSCLRKNVQDYCNMYCSKSSQFKPSFFVGDKTGNT